MVDEETGKVVDKEDKGRGYELGKGRYVAIEEDELEAVQLESTHTVDIDSFVPQAEIDTRYRDRPYYVVPDGEAGVEAYAVIRDAMKDKERAALARIVIARREHVIALEPLGNGFSRRRCATITSCATRTTCSKGFRAGRCRGTRCNSPSTFSTRRPRISIPAGSRINTRPR